MGKREIRFENIVHKLWNNETNKKQHENGYLRGKLSENTKNRTMKK